MQKIAITGHTQGIGLGLSQALSDQGYHVDGYSRSTGHDLATMDLNALASKISTADVFINNAYHQEAQVVLLHKLFSLWQSQDKLIINISSDSTDFQKTRQSIYSTYKGALDLASLQLRNLDARCRVVNLRPGYVDTDRVHDIDIKKLPVKHVVEIVTWLLHQPADLYIKELTFSVR